MATARFYAVNENASSVEGKKYFSSLKGQAKIVAEELFANTTPRLGTEIEKECGSKIKTKQDTLRIVLYYICIFKSKKFVSSFDELPKIEEPSFEHVICNVLEDLKNEDTCN
jgi:hypothetical protein